MKERFHSIIDFLYSLLIAAVIVVACLAFTNQPEGYEAILSFLGALLGGLITLYVFLLSQASTGKHFEEQTRLQILPMLSANMINHTSSEQRIDATISVSSDGTIIWENLFSIPKLVSIKNVGNGTAVNLSIEGSSIFGPYHLFVKDELYVFVDWQNEDALKQSIYFRYCDLQGRSYRQELTFKSAGKKTLVYCTTPKLITRSAAPTAKTDS